MQNLFSDICETLNHEDDLYMESVSNIFALESLNEEFDAMEAEDIAMESTEEMSELEVFFYGESTEDEDEQAEDAEPVTEGVDIKGMAKRAKEVIVNAIKWIIEQLKKFAAMVKQRVQTAFAKRNLKKRLAEAKKLGKGKTGAKIEVLDVVKVTNLEIKYTKDLVKFMDDVVSKYKKGEVSEDDFDKYDDRAEKAHNAFRDELAKIKDKPIQVGYETGIRYAEEATKWLENDKSIAELNAKYVRLSKEFSDCQFNFYNQAFEESADDELFTEAKKDPANPGRMATFLKATSSAFRENKALAITAMISYTVKVLSGLSSLSERSKEQRTEYTDKHQSSLHKQNADLLGRVSDYAGGVNDVTTVMFGKKVYDNYKKERAAQKAASSNSND